MKLVLRDEDIPQVISTVNEKGLKDWITTGLAVQAVLVELNLIKNGM